MFVAKYSPAHLDAIAELEEQSYPEHLQYGRGVLESELSKEGNCSMVVFQNGLPVGYIIAYMDECENHYCYISDLNCPNKRALPWLLAAFFLQHHGRYKAECRPQSLMLLENHRIKGIIEILAKIEMPNYYGPGEPGTKVKFRVDPYNLKDIPIQCLKHLAANRYMVGIQKVLGYFDTDAFTAELALQHKAAILRYINAHNLELYRMFGGRIPITINVEKKFSTIKAAFEYGEALQRAGFKQIASGYCNPGEYRLSEANLDYRYSEELYNDKVYHDLSSARYIFRKLGMSENVQVLLTDRYGDEYNGLNPPPYCNRLTYDYIVRYIVEGTRLDNRVKASKASRYGMNKPSSFLKDMTKIVGFQSAVRIMDTIVDRWEELESEQQRNFIHDWNVVIEKLLAARALLTKGAFEACLQGSYNAAKKQVEMVTSINSSIDAASKGRKKNNHRILHFVKATRRRMSYLLRNGQSLEELREEVAAIAKKLVSEKYKLTAKELKAASEFLTRMARYHPHIDIPQLFGVFGKTWTKKVLTGAVNGIFQPVKFVLGDHYLCQEVLKLFHSRTKQAKGVYNDLRQERLLDGIQQAHLSDDQRERVKMILKRRNYKLSEEASKASEFSALVEPKCSPEYLVAGDASVCCMSFGQQKAKEYAIQEGFGILNIYYGNRIIANSVLWIEDGHQCLVLDNIEVHLNYVCYNKQIEELYKIAIDDLLAQYKLLFAVQGRGYSDLKLPQAADVQIRLNMAKARNISGHSFYSDAEQSYVVHCAVPVEEVNKIAEREKQNTQHVA